MTATIENHSSIHDNAFVRGFCRTALPGLLGRAGVSPADAETIALDVIRRARMLAALPVTYFDVLITPFIEEVSQHRPLSAPAWLRAAVVVAVRNSRLEDFHALDGPLHAVDIAAITEAATAPLATFLDEPGQPVKNNALAGLDNLYPRAWACLTALSDLMESESGGERTYEMPQAPQPQLPTSDEITIAKESTAKPIVAGQSVIVSGIDPRFDQALLTMLRQVRDGTAEVVPVSALSRLSRNSGKQLRVLGFLLAHQATVLTTNHLLAPGTVGVRARPLVKPDSYDPRRSWKQLRGLGPTHIGWVKVLRKQL